MIDSNTPDWAKPDKMDSKYASACQNWVEEKPAAASASASATTIETGLENNNYTEERSQHLSRSEYWSCNEFIKRDGRLLLITILIITCMNLPVLRYLVYPFTIFSTFIHEICHGLAAVFVGGKIVKIFIYPDGSGLCYYLMRGMSGRGFVSSAGYQGTAVVGCLFLLLRRTKRGPRVGMTIMALFMFLSVILWIRNPFGIIMMLLLTVLFALASWKLSSGRIRDLYVTITVTTTLNAITSVTILFGSNFTVGGETFPTDAHTMADLTGMHRFGWALMWLLLALFLALIGLVFAIPGPDEPTFFKCCEICQECGCFAICNFERKRDKTNTSTGTIEQVVVSSSIS